MTYQLDQYVLSDIKGVSLDMIDGSVANDMHTSYTRQHKCHLTC